MSMRDRQEAIKVQKTVAELVNIVASLEHRVQELEDSYMPLHLENVMKMEKHGRPKKTQ